MRAMCIIQDLSFIQQEYFIPIALWALFTACLSLFLDKCFQEGMIFSGWLEFWGYWWLKENKWEFFDATIVYTDDETKLHTSGRYDTTREWLFSEVRWFWFKPLGYCVVCMNVWINFFWLFFSGLDLFSCLFSLVISNLLVRYLKEKL